jgi:hypothetical protein
LSSDGLDWKAGTQVRRWKKAMAKYIQLLLFFGLLRFVKKVFWVRIQVPWSNLLHYYILLQKSSVSKFVCSIAKCSFLKLCKFYHFW